MQVEDEEYVLRPMNCPHHMVMYANDIHSYRDLPIRIAEIARDCRYEASGSLKGIERVRTFCQNDCHIFCTPEQIEDEFKGVIDLILEVYKELGIKNYRFELSLRDPEDKVKYFQDDDMWNKAEDALRKIMDDLKIPYVEKKGEAAFYGPKCDVQVQPAVGNEITLSTCQIDFCLPMKFDLTYVDKDGSKKTPVVLHRAILGSIDRAIAFYLEETKGNLPLWLAPEQMVILPVNNEYHLSYAKEVYNKLRELNYRVKLDDRDEKVSYRMRESQVKKIPITIILGQKETDDKLISFRRHGEQETTTVTYDEFIKLIDKQIK
jgi:threonyl-tRNA synthetase